MDPAVYIKALVGRNLKSIRERNGMTQEMLASLASVTSKTITNIENAATYPRPETIKSLSDALHISPAELFLTEKEKDADSKDSMQGLAMTIFKRELADMKKVILELFDSRLEESSKE